MDLFGTLYFPRLDFSSIFYQLHRYSLKNFQKFVSRFEATSMCSSAFPLILETAGFEQLVLALFYAWAVQDNFPGEFRCRKKEIVWGFSVVYG